MMNEKESNIHNSRKRLADLVRGRIDKDLAFALCIGCEVYGVIDEAIEYLESRPTFTEEDFVEFVYAVIPEEDRLD